MFNKQICHLTISAEKADPEQDYHFLDLLEHLSFSLPFFSTPLSYCPTFPGSFSPSFANAQALRPPSCLPAPFNIHLLLSFNPSLFSQSLPLSFPLSLLPFPASPINLHSELFFMSLPFGISLPNYSS